MDSFFASGKPNFTLIPSGESYHNRLYPKVGSYRGGFPLRKVRRHDCLPLQCLGFSATGTLRCCWVAAAAARSYWRRIIAALRRRCLGCWCYRVADVAGLLCCCCCCTLLSAWIVAALLSAWIVAAAVGLLILLGSLLLLCHCCWCCWVAAAAASRRFARYNCIACTSKSCWEKAARSASWNVEPWVFLPTIYLDVFVHNSMQLLL